MSDDNREWKPLFSFDIDDGELDGKTPQECFTLGYELALIRDVYAKLPEGGCWTVHAANTNRIHRALSEACREFELAWMHADASESWMRLTIDPEVKENSK